tara:strand:+ start:10351 stop:12069 length:1719 start_codon:yes stop_codon:yes gene_type:complete
MSIQICAILPTYKHVAELERIITRLRALQLDVIVVDDGNAQDIAGELSQICSRFEGVDLVRREQNGGKGGAVIKGMRRAVQLGFSHALQVDSDGQHDLASVTDMLALARQFPDALVTGEPRFDDSVPRGRLIGRWITHIWVSINTLSPRIIDTMCGFRVYPLAASLAASEGALMSKRMGFDTEIVVRLRWRGIDIKTLPVNVTYPVGNYSNFKFSENVGVSAMHARLFLGMLWRSPYLIWTRLRATNDTSTHWAKLGERGGALGLWILAGAFRLFGRHVSLALMTPVVLFFFLTGKTQRRASRDFLERLWRAGGLVTRPGWFMSFRHFMSFGAAALDKFAAWTGNIPAEDVDGVEPSVFDVVHSGGKGAFVLTAHLGNPEVIRAISTLKKRARVNVLVHTAHAVRFNALIQAYSAGSTVRMIEVTEVGPDTAIILQAAIADGEIVVIVGDRIPVSGTSRVCWVNFFGSPAPFAQGPHILASILKCPVYLLFCVRFGARHKIFFEHFADRIELPRKDREAAIQSYVERYAARLEHFVRLAPLQWFNFFDYWRPEGLEAPLEQAQSNSKSEMAS